MQRRGPGQPPPPPPRQSEPYPPTEPPLHSHSPFPSASSYAATPAAAHFSRSDKTAERHSRPARHDPTRPATAAHTLAAAAAPPLPTSPTPPLSQSSRAIRSPHSSSRVSKQYDAASRGTVFCLTSPASFLSLPTHPKPASPSLLQPFLVLQLALPPLTSPSTSSSFSLQLALLSTSQLTYSVVLSSSVSSVALLPFGAELPLSLASGAWLNVCVPVRDLLWDVLQVEYGGVESVTLKGQCKVRRVFGMRHAVRTSGQAAEDEDEEDDEHGRYERREIVPAEHDFEPDVLHTTILYSQHIQPTHRRAKGQSRRREQAEDESREERVDESRRRVPRAARATMPYHRSRVSAAEAPHAPSQPHWEGSIEPTDESASAAPFHRTAASKTSARTKRSTQPLPSRTLAAVSEKRPVSQQPVAYQMVPFTESPNPASDSAAAARLPASLSSPPVSRQLHKEKRNERRRTAEDKADVDQQRQSDEAGRDASAGLVFHPARRATAGSPLSPSSTTLPSRSPVPLAHAASSDVRLGRSPLHVRQQPPLTRTYTAPETIDVQHNVVGRRRRDSRDEERRQEDEEEQDTAEVAMERAGTDEVYRTSPVVREHERRLEQRQHRRSRRRREDRRDRDEDEPTQQPVHSHAPVVSTARLSTRASVTTQPSYAFRPDLSSAESTPNSASAASSHTASRRHSLSSSSSLAMPISGSEMSSATVSLSSTPFASFPSSPTTLSARQSLIAHAVTSHHSAPPSRRPSLLQANKERESDELDWKDEKRSQQRRSSSTSRPVPAMLPRVAEMENNRHATSLPLTSAVNPPTQSSSFASSALAAAYAPVDVAAVPDEPAAGPDTRHGLASLFSSPSASVSNWPAVSTGPTSPPPFSAIRSSFGPFSFVAKLTEPTAPPSSALPASVPVSSTTSPATAFRPLFAVSQPVSPSPAAALPTDWARRTLTTDESKKTREKVPLTAGSVAVAGDRGQERVLEEIEEEANDQELDESQVAEDELEAVEDDDDNAREHSGLVNEPVSGTQEPSQHSDRSHHSGSGSSASGQSTNNSSPRSARVMAVSQHLRRLSMKDSSYDEPEEQVQHEAGGSEDQEVDEVEDMDQKQDEDEDEEEEDVGIASIPHFIHQLPASSTDVSFGSDSLARPVRSAPLLSLPSTSLVPLSTASPERPAQSAPHTPINASTPSAPPPPPSSLPAAPSAHPPPPTTSLIASTPVRLPAASPRSSRPVSSGDLLVRYDPDLKAYFCPDNGRWYELKSDDVD